MLQTLYQGSLKTVNSLQLCSKTYHNGGKRYLTVCSPILMLKSDFSDFVWSSMWWWFFLGKWNTEERRKILHWGWYWFEIQNLHDNSENAEGGHSRITATVKKAKRIFIFPSMKTDITNLIRECDVCQRNKPEHVPSPGLLQPIEIPVQSWEVIIIDFIDGLPKSKGKIVILVVIDKLTKYCHLMALSHPYTTQSVAEELLNSVVKLHGTPLAIISDRDLVFVSSFWRELLNLPGTKN